MAILIIGEKPSVSRAISSVVGADTAKKGYTEGNGYIVSWCVGHLVGLKYPNDYGIGWEHKWNFSQLPMIPEKWQFTVTESTKSQYNILKNLMNRSDMTEIICATDADREGETIFRYAALAIKYADTPVKVGSFQGFDLSITMNSNLMGGGMTACLKGAASHTTKLIESFAHNLNRIESALYNIDGRITNTKENLAKLRIDYTEAQKIVAEPFPQQAELESKEDRLKTLTDELNKAAIEAKKNAPKREKTCYFERAKMKRDAMRIAKKPKQNKDKGKDKKQPDLQ